MDRLDADDNLLRFPRQLLLIPPSSHSRLSFDVVGLTCVCVCAFNGQTSLGSSAVTTERPTFAGPLILLSPSARDRPSSPFYKSCQLLLAASPNSPHGRTSDHVCHPFSTALYHGEPVSAHAFQPTRPVHKVGLLTSVHSNQTQRHAEVHLAHHDQLRSTCVSF